MERNVVITADGSHTVAVPQLNVTYHPVYGAVQESRHVFIAAGLRHLLNQAASQPVTIFEMGFGTGLNAFLTAIEAAKTKTKIHYTAVETSPLSPTEVSNLNYSAAPGHRDLFHQLHQCKWSEEVMLDDFFTLKKVQTDLLNFSTDQLFNLIYYDAFAPLVQPELWTKEVFEKLFSMLAKGGLLVTYCSKGDVRRAMTAVGFDVEKLPGSKGKREMLRATRTKT